MNGENFIPSEICARIIDKFEKGDNKRNGTTTKGLDTGIQAKYRDTTIWKRSLGR